MKSQLQHIHIDPGFLHFLTTSMENREDSNDQLKIPSYNMFCYWSDGPGRSVWIHSESSSSPGKSSTRGGEVPSWLSLLTDASGPPSRALVDCKASCAAWYTVFKVLEIPSRSKSHQGIPLAYTKHMINCGTKTSVPCSLLEWFLWLVM